MLSSNSENILEIDFIDALIKGRGIEKAHPECRFIASNGESRELV